MKLYNDTFKFYNPFKNCAAKFVSDKFKPMKKVILVDDDVDDLEVFRSILEEGNNITATCLDNRAELFKLLEISKSNPDLIILDLFLNQDSGLEILKLIKSNPLYHSIPVAIITGTELEKERCEAAGCIFYEKKPNDLLGYRDLVKRVNELKS